MMSTLGYCDYEATIYQSASFSFSPEPRQIQRSSQANRDPTSPRGSNAPPSPTGSASDLGLTEPS